tara:strand:+ start:108 stop:611 length:504 start_codon:yes stop_codon:yes gene_type:complete
MNDDELQILSTQLTFENGWDFWVKTNASAWDLKKMKQIYTIRTIADMWHILNNVPSQYVGICNIFIMHSGVKPLWESNGSMFQNGGCWSVVIRKHGWRDILNELVMSLVGEMFFGDNVKGACIIPVSTTHVICKIWCTSKMIKDSTSLTNALSTFGADGARFKQFVI